MNLVLFDIDGTLVTTGGAGRAAMTETGRRLFGVDDLFADISFAGSVDLEIVSRAMRSRGIAPTPRRMGRFRARYLRELKRMIGRHTIEICPGVEDLLDEIGGRIPLGLQTGNWREGARIKLEACGLWQRFLPVMGGFGGDTDLRDDLIPLALARARRRGLPVERVVVLGDTPADIRCSRAGMELLGPGAPELVTVGVKTGFASPEALAASAPDLLLDDLEQGRDAVLALLR